MDVQLLLNIFARFEDEDLLALECLFTLNFNFCETFVSHFLVVQAFYK